MSFCCGKGYQIGPPGKVRGDLLGGAVVVLSYIQRKRQKKEVQSTKCKIKKKLEIKKNKQKRLAAVGFEPTPQ